jgi:peptidoglycan/xylan/chitin deacetylase (PgdA/CDA1 family)
MSCRILPPGVVRARAAAVLALALFGAALAAPSAASATEHVVPRSGTFTGDADVLASKRADATVAVSNAAISRIEIDARATLLDAATSTPGCALGRTLVTTGYARSGGLHRDGSFEFSWTRPVPATDGTTGTDTITAAGRFTDSTHVKATVRDVVDSLSADGLTAQHCASVPVKVVATHPAGVMWPFPQGPRDIDCAKLKCVALTFDDGPGKQTKTLLEMLRRAHARATFFSVGEMVAQRPGDLRRIDAAGHEIGDHSWSHPLLTSLSDSQIHRQVASTASEIKRAIGRKPELMRPPYGGVNSRVRADLGKDGWPIVLWTVDPLDWKDRNTTIVANRVLSQVTPGAIVLMHDIHPTTVAAVPRILKELARRGYTFVTVSELYGGKALTAGKVYHGNTEAYAREH